jgi:hypothetical protein
LLETFKREARPYIGYAPPNDNDIEWLAIGQHHQLVTRLLDWTTSIFIAAYFATEKGDVNKTARIYCVQEFDSILERGPKNIFEADRPFTYRPPHISPRIPAQRAIFTVHHKPDEYLQSKSLQIFDIPGRHCVHLKRMLDVAGFNRASLFPDLDGLSVHLSWRYKWNLPF